MLQADKFAVKRRKISWCNAHSRLAKQLVTPPEWPAPPVDPARIMNRIIDRVQGSRPSKRIRQLRLHVWQQARRGRRTPSTQVAGPLRTRIPSPEETGGHELMLSDGNVWCNECGLYSRKRQSRQFGVACTQVARASLAALREGRHPVKGFHFRDTHKVMAEVFARAAHTAQCIVRQESQRLLYEHDAMSCSCFPPSEGARQDNPFTLA